jgi:uncharacterized protein YktA (UPF0223 family)
MIKIIISFQEGKIEEYYEEDLMKKSSVEEYKKHKRILEGGSEDEDLGD